MDPRIDAYILKSATFAQPILKKLRQIVWKGCPGVEETIKWGMPHFLFNGANLCNMAAFSQHCAFGFWKASIMEDPDRILHRENKNAMGQLNRIHSLRDLPSSQILVKYVKQAAQLNADLIKLPPRKKPTAGKTLKIPAQLAEALKKNPKAKKYFEGLSFSHRKEYIEWISEARREPTRIKRVAQALDWLNQGKTRNWKYK